MALYNITSNEIVAVRSTVIDAVNARMAWERENPAQRSLESKLDFLVTFRKRVERADSFTLGFLHHNPVAFDSIFLSHRRSNEAFNIYAMTKALEVARCLNGGALTPAMGGDNMTLAGVIIALHNGITLESKIAHSVNMFAQNDCNRPNYSSGATQTSSSLRALEAFGIVKRTGKLGNCQVWGIDDVERFERMHDASNGISVASVTIAEEQKAIEESADSSTKAGRAKSRKEGKGKRTGKGKGVSAAAPAESVETPVSDDASGTSVDASDAMPSVDSDGNEIPAF